MTKTCVLTKDTDGIVQMRNRRQVRFTITITTDSNDAGADNGETITTVLGGNSKTVTVSTVDATNCSLGQAIGLVNKLDFIQQVTPFLDSQSSPAVAYAAVIPLTTAKCVLLGASATAGQLRDNATVAIPTGTYTSKFIAQGY